MVAFGVILLLALAWVYATERVTVLSALAVLCPAAGLLITWPQLRAHPALRAVFALNVALILLYFWALGESHHVSVQVSPGRIVAQVDGDTATLNEGSSGERFGFQGGLYSSYRIQATGEAQQTDTQSWTARLGQAVRLAEPGTAWTNMRILVPHGAGYAPGKPLLEGPAGSWSKNRRDEWEGPPGSYVVFPASVSPKYTISADLMRPDGGQDLLLGVDPNATGLVLQIRFDQPDMQWIRWHAGMEEAGLGGSYLQHVDAVASLQRDVRLLLSGYLFALLFLALAIGVYPILLVLLRPLQDPREDEWAVFRRLSGTARFAWVYCAVVALAGVVATGLVSTFLLDRMPHVQDSVAYLYQAKIFALGSFNVPAPPASLQPFFSEEYMPFYHGRWFSQYPPGHPLMLTLGVLLGAGWLAEPVLASLALVGVYLLGRRVYGNGVGMLAGILGLSSPFWLFLGSEFMSHPTGLFFIVGFMLCFAQMERERRIGWPVLAGFLAGMAFITRELTAVGALAPFAVYTVYWARFPWRTYLAAAVGFLLPAAFLPIYNWVQMGNPLVSTYAAWGTHYRMGFGPDKPPFGDFTLGDGLSNTWQNLSMLAAHLYGWPYAVAFAFMFLPFILGAAQKWDYLLLASFLGIVVCYVFYWCPCLMYGPRFYYEALGPLLLLSSRGIFELARLPLRVWRHLPGDPAWGSLLPAVLLVVLGVYNLRFYLPAQMPLYRGYNYSSGAELQTVAKAHIHHAIVFVAPQMAWFWAGYGNVFFANDPLLRGDIIYVRDLGVQNPILYRYFPGRTHYRLVESPAQGGLWTLTRIS